MHTSYLFHSDFYLRSCVAKLNIQFRSYRRWYFCYYFKAPLWQVKAIEMIKGNILFLNVSPESGIVCMTNALLQAWTMVWAWLPRWAGSHGSASGATQTVTMTPSSASGRICSNRSAVLYLIAISCVPQDGRYAGHWRLQGSWVWHGDHRRLLAGS